MWKFIRSSCLAFIGTSILLLPSVLPKSTLAQTPAPINSSIHNSHTKGSGIEGIVIISPISPIERPGVINYRPYEATITVLDEKGKTVTQFQSGPDGTFRVKLKPGIYTLRPESEINYPRAEEQKITVSKKEFTQIKINYNSGIR